MQSKIKLLISVAVIVASLTIVAATFLVIINHDASVTISNHDHPIVGTWKTQDGDYLHLLPDGSGMAVNITGIGWPHGIHDFTWRIRDIGEDRYISGFEGELLVFGLRFPIAIWFTFKEEDSLITFQSNFEINLSDRLTSSAWERVN